MRNAMEPETRMAPRPQNETRSGHFRIYFTGFREKPVGPPAAPAGPSAWNAPEAEDDRAYFQADISWINLSENDSPQNSVLTAMITGDVRGLRKGPAGASSAPDGETEWLPLSLGTYALVSGSNAIAIGQFTIRSADSLRKTDRGACESAAPVPAGNPHVQAGNAVDEPVTRKWPRGESRSCLVDIPLLNPTRSKTIFLTYQSANALSKLDQGFGRGVFPIECGCGVNGRESGREYTLYFGIDRL